ncbi:MAG: zinc permease [Acidithiobacillales bacterium SG8_45]|jgi:ZIP family zinc transporter|nr:MAG: zinc permease [Acidithiobacillales bacterium SG8_45]
MEPSTYLVVLLLATLSGLTTVLGVLLAVYVSRSSKWIAVGIGFSVGIMLLIALFELIPESLATTKSSTALIAVVLGATCVGMLHYVIPHTHLFKERGIVDPKYFRTAYLVSFGLILHDFPEGFAMANSYLTSPSLGIAVALAIALHNIPEEFAMAVPLVATRSRAFLLRAAILSGMAEPAGAAIGLFAASVNPGLVPMFMAFAAGAMIFVSVHELIPMARKYGRLSLFGLGMGASIVVYVLLALLVPE